MDTLASAPALRPARELTRFRTDAIDAWGATLSEKLITLRPDTRTLPDAFFGRLVIARFHNSMVANVHTSAHRVMRNRELVSHDERRYCKIVWQIDGCTQLEHRGGCTVIRPGEWALYDASLPYAFGICSAARFMVLLLPLDEFSEYSADIERIAGKALPARGNADVVRAALSSVLAGGLAFDEEGQRVLQDSILALTGNAIRLVGDPTKDAMRTSHRKLQVAQAFIEQNLTEPLLTPDKVAIACGMSRRSLYDAFGTLAQTPRAYIQQQRLARACELLADREGRYTITQIAYELGFADAAHFSRLFNERYGVTPSQWRRTQALIQ